MAAPKAATVPVFTDSAHSLEPLILDHKKGGKAAQRGVRRLFLDVPLRERCSLERPKRFYCEPRSEHFFKSRSAAQAAARARGVAEATRQAAALSGLQSSGLRHVRGRSPSGPWRTGWLQPPSASRCRGLRPAGGRCTGARGWNRKGVEAKTTQRGTAPSPACASLPSETNI